MNDQELTAAVRQSVEGARMDVPEEQITSRGRAIRAARRRRLAAGVTAIATAGAAAIAAALILPGPAAPAAQDTAYVVSHATQALTAVPPGTIVFVQASTTRPGSEVTDTWAGDGRLRIESFTRAGQPIFDRVSARTSTTEAVVLINYRDRTWTRRASQFGELPAPSAAAPAGAQGSFTCDSANEIFGIPLNASDMAASLRDWESCGWLKADGTATVGGVTAIRLTMPTGDGYATTWYVSPATYLPILQTVTRQGTLLSTQAFQWLPPTTANLARLALPAVPRGFSPAPALSPATSTTPAT
jgi:hypothetical protein